jgi:hypothetical protein
VTIPQCPQPLFVTVPDYFNPVQKADWLANGFNENPARTARYSTAFIADEFVDKDLSVPAFLMFGTLGTVMRVQGRINRADFEKLKADGAFAHAQPFELPGAIEHMERLLEGIRSRTDQSVQIDKPIYLGRTEIGGSAFALIALSSGAFGNYHWTAISAMRLDYVQGCLVFTQFQLPIRVRGAEALKIVESLKIQ